MASELLLTCINSAILHGKEPNESYVGNVVCILNEAVEHMNMSLVCVYGEYYNHIKASLTKMNIIHKYKCSSKCTVL